MRYQQLSAILIALSTIGCGSGKWMSRDFTPFGKRERPPESVSEMLASGSTRTTVAKSDQPKTSRFSKRSDKLADIGFVERLGSARASEQAGKHDLARGMYEKLIVEFPNRHEPYHRLGVVADRQRRHREAQSLYTQALLIKPMDAEIFNDLGYCFFLQGKLTKAESALLKGVSLSPSDGRLRNNLGMVLGHLGREQEALEQFRRAGSEADAQYNLAFVQFSRGKTEEARQRLEVALLSDPGHEQARVTLEEIEAMENGRTGLVDNKDLRIPPAPPKSGRFVPFLEDIGNEQPNAALTSGSDAIQEVGEGSGTLHSSQRFQSNFGSRSASNSLDKNAAAKSLESLGYSDNAQTQMLQARAREMMEARLQGN